MRFRRPEHILPHRTEAPQGFTVEAALHPFQRQRLHTHLLQWQSPLFLRSGRSGDSSASQNAAPIKKGPWYIVFGMASGGAQGKLTMPRASSTRGPSTSRSSKWQPSVSGTVRFPSCVRILGSNRVRPPPPPRPANQIQLPANSQQRATPRLPRAATDAATRLQVVARISSPHHCLRGAAASTPHHSVGLRWHAMRHTRQ
ncbi:hypothetical protein TRVL_06558 [Trypanosoma vivax]|nr:hypothetical protein TRVL_06558 [Trypanosoma vivax]